MTASWNETPAGLLRNRGWYAEDAALDKAREFNSVERRAARMAFDAAWGSPENWTVDSSGSPVNARAVQEQLAARGWTGAWIDVPNTIPPELRPLHAQAELSRTRQASVAAGRKDPEWQRLEAEMQARYEAAKARMDSKLGPMAKTIGFGGP